MGSHDADGSDGCLQNRRLGGPLIGAHSLRGRLAKGKIIFVCEIHDLTMGSSFYPIYWGMPRRHPPPRGGMWLSSLCLI